VRKVVFLDRDGVINNNSLYYTYHCKDFKINDGLIESLQILTERGFEFIIITNQSGISKGIYSKKDVEKVHQFLLHELNNSGISILEIYYCTHHSDVEACLCRKPNPLLIEKAISRFQINPLNSYFIGDQQRDVDTAIAAGIKPVLIEPNSNLKNVLDKII
jgi:D-glycero-D-manno-heptose 1,7-bisphosphate phosphatase